MKKNHRTHSGAIFVFVILVTSRSSAFTLSPLQNLRSILDVYEDQTRALSRPALYMARSDPLDGVKTFEDWFSSVPGATCDPGVTHNTFGGFLRGLEFQGSKDISEQVLMSIPRSVVLSSDYSDPNWDVQLAKKLWEECSKGTASEISGYTSLLTKDWDASDISMAPPSTAPDALRHWNAEQRKVLLDSSVGQELLRLQEQQETQWKEKFKQVNGMTWEQFEWAMEAVHSRAFRGDFGLRATPLNPTIATLIPVLAAVVGYVYFVQFHGQDDTVLLGLGVATIAPSVLSLVSPDNPVAVLLPLIDSANHLETADSSIEYSPLSDKFTLSVSKNCLIDDDEKTQLYISYGKKKDTELLLNYGFLNGLVTTGDNDERRSQLASTFLSNQTN